MRVKGRLGLVLLAILVVAATGMSLLGGPAPAAEQAPGPVPAPARAVTLADDAGIRADPRIRSFLAAYGAFIDSVEYQDDDATFFMGSHPIRFLDGRMLREGREGRASDFAPIFYRYSLQPLAEPPPNTGRPVYSTDVLVSLFGRRESQIRAHCESATFLDHKIFVNTLLLEPLQAVEADVRDAAQGDTAVARWIRNLDVVYSFASRGIAGSDTRSYHAWGMAVDLRPASFHGKHVYWRWSRAQDGRSWSTIPLKRRWSPPEPVIEAFERHGFVWGGKWFHFDTIHFEYRPEIILYNRMLTQGHGPAAG